MKNGFAVAAVVCLSVGLAACEGSAASTSACSTSADIARKVTALTDDLNKARTLGKISDERAGQVAAAMLEAGRTKDANTYCTALDTVRTSARL